MNPARVLLLIRNGDATDVDSLCVALYGSPSYTFKGLILQILGELEKAGLIFCDPPMKNVGMYENANAQIKLSNKWPLIQSALGLSLTELASINPDKAMFVSPHFGRPHSISAKNKLDVFVLMPFQEDLKPIYEDHIKPVAKRMKLSVKRGDDFFTARHVMTDIWEAICSAKIVIADCTGRNPNVFYEIGIAHTIGKLVVLISQNAEDVPFDLRQLRYIVYKYTPPGMKEFEHKLAETLKGAI